MTARPLVVVQEAPAGTTVPLPTVFTSPVRDDVVQFVHTNLAKNRRQASGVFHHAGHQHSAESWGTGRAVSRIPRVSGGGTRRAGQGAFGNMCVKGRMFAPLQTWRRWHRAVNVNQKRFAVASSLAASAVPALVMARGHQIARAPEIPLVVSRAALDAVKKTKDATALFERIGAADDVARVKVSRAIRAGRGKMRNRRYRQRRGPLFVYARGGDFTRAVRNLPGVELCHVSRLNLLQLAPGGHLGRFVVWADDAFAQLDALYGTYTESAQRKAGYRLPRAKMSNADVGRIINSDEVQSVLRDAVKPRKHHQTARHKNALRNLGTLIKLNPYAKVQRRAELLLAERRAQAKASDAVAAGKADYAASKRKSKRGASKAALQAKAPFYALLKSE